MQLKIKSVITWRGDECEARAIDRHTKAVLAVAKIVVSADKKIDLKSMTIYGNSAMKHIEEQAREIAISLAEQKPRTPK